MTEKRKKGRVKIESLPLKEKELAGGQAATIKGGAGNSGAGGGDPRRPPLATEAR